MDIGDRLRERRLELGLTQEQVALKSDMNVTQYNGYERSRSRPSPVTLPRLAAALDTTLEILLGRAPANTSASGDRTPNPADTIRRFRAQFRDQVAAELGLDPADVGVRIEFL